MNSTLSAIGLKHNKHIPAAYLRASIGQRLSLLQGLMDTDGSISKLNGSCEFSSTSDKLSSGVVELLISLGIKARRHESVATIYGRHTSPLWRIIFQPPHDLPVFRLRRKLAHQIKRHNRRELSGDRRIVDVRPVPSVPVRCIAVNSPSRLYLAGRSMVPTHNTPMLAGIGLYGLGFDSENSAEIYSAAFDRDQASIVLNDARRMAQSGELAEADIFNVGKYNIADESSQSFFRAVSSEHRSKSGPRPHMILIDELHEHRDGTVVNKMRAGFKGRTQPLMPVITNSGHDRQSVCWAYHQHSLAVLEGHIQDEQWFAYVCHLDPCQDCFDNGYRQPKEGCAKCDDWTHPDCWLKANPSLGVTIQSSYLQTQVDLALAMPSEQAMVKRLNFCLWTESHVVWISPDRLDACRVEAVSTNNLLDKLPCAAGLDLSSKIDLSSFVIALRHDDPPAPEPAEVVEIQGKDDAGQVATLTITLNFSIELIPFFWIPQETMLERVKTERISYDVWHRQGKLLVTHGGVIDHQAIYDEIVSKWKQYRIHRMGYDPRDATMLAVSLRDRARLGDGIVELGQAKKLSEAFKLMEVLIRSRRLKHDGHPVLAWNFANAEPKRDRMGALWIEKPSETKRIDGVVAAAMAIHQLMVLPPKRTRKPFLAFV